MKHIDLFSGIGGFALAATWVWGDEYENVGHSEVGKYPCKVYHNHFPESECLGDITKIDWSRFAGTIDLVTGGFPCQPHSVAGKRKGSGDERDLWSECVRAIREIRPRFALFENVPGLFTSNGGRFFNRVLADISASGYDCEWQVLSAAEVGAWHKRERVWILSYPVNGEHRGRRGQNRETDGVQEVDRTTVRAGESCRTGGVPHTSRNDANRDSGEFSQADEQQESERQEERLSEFSSAGDVPNAESTKCEQSSDSRNRRNGFTDGSDNATNSINTTTTRQRINSGQVYAEPESKRFIERGCEGWWAVECRLGELADGLSVAVDVADRERGIRVATGVPKRVDQLKGLGNAIVPQCAAVIMERIKESMRMDSTKIGEVR